MEPYRYHVVICDQKRPEGVPSCPARGATATIAALRKEVAAGGLLDEVQVTTCGPLGVGERGLQLLGRVKALGGILLQALLDGAFEEER